LLDALKQETKFHIRLGIRL